MKRRFREQRSGAANDCKVAVEKMDSVIRLLEDVFILQALGAGIGRDNICAAIGVHTTRVSAISKGMKRVPKHGKDNS